MSEPENKPTPSSPDSAPAGQAEADSASAAQQEAVSPEDYRAVMRHWPSGVTVITMREGERNHGMTASAFTSVSLSPPMVLIVVDRRWRSHDFIEAGGIFCVNILAEDQSQWSDRFAGRHGEMPDRFVDVPTTTAVTGAPCLEEAAAWLDCRVSQTHRAGDHTIFIGCVVAARVLREDALPLVYHDGSYRRLLDES